MANQVGVGFLHSDICINKSNSTLSKVYSFDFLQPLFEGCGYQKPSLVVPTFLVFYLAWFIEGVHSWISPFWNFQPLLTRAEVYKTGITHYFTIGELDKSIR